MPNWFDRIAIAFYLIAGMFFLCWGIFQLSGFVPRINAWSDLLALLCAFIFWGMAWMQHYENTSREEQAFRSRLRYIDRF